MSRRSYGRGRKKMMGVERGRGVQREEQKRKRKKGRRRRKRKEEEGKKRGSVSREGDREDGGAGEKPLASRPWKK